MHFRERRTRVQGGCGVGVLALCAALAWAQDEVMTPHTEVIGHYETGIGSSDAASEGSVTYKRIESRPLLRPGEVVELVPGMIVTQHSGDGKANQYFLRGYNLDHGTDFALWADGMPINMPTHGHGQGYADINWTIPELMSGIDFRKGPYFAQEGDFASAGAARIRYFDTLPQNIGSITVGSNDYLRLVAAASPKLGAGHLLIAAEANYADGPWDEPEDLRKYNAVLRYSQGDAHGGFHAALMAYDGQWTSTDQIAQRAVDTGRIDRFGTLDPTDGGESSRYSLSFGGYKGLGTGQARVDVYAINYKLDLFSNFTYFLNDPINGDQFQQADRRTVYGINPSYAWPMKLGDLDMTNTIGLQSRYDDISRVALYDTRARDILSTTRRDEVKELAVSLYAENATQWNKWLRSVVGVRGDFYSFDVDSSIPENSGSEDDSMVSPKLSLIFGPWGQDRILCQCRLRLPQQRCPRHNDHGRSEHAAAGCPGRSAGADQGRGARRAHGDHQGLAELAGVVGVEARLRIAVRRRCRHHRTEPPQQARGHRVDQLLAAVAVAAGRRRVRLDQGALHR